ncbi:unnamed protein product [Triticum turgidum subsp. durum]|uniref:Uncharacterized protein n=1 Tax=Triticum turgidum subsp. durum TaxID=4567 RepID=A0A9R0XSV4_TRITD|nr:unnamed protein product [Triticum turgidum subsp. durum]
MLRLRTSILTHLAIPSSSAYPCSSPCRLLSATAPPISPNPSSFAVEDYLVGTCGLTRPQALKASAKLSHLKSPSKPDAVLAFLAGLGLSGADAAAVVVKDPRLLCAKVDKTLAPVVAGLTGLGLSRSEIGRLVSLAPANSRCRSIVSKLDYYLPLFGSIDNLLRPLRRSNCLLRCNLDKVVKPNVAFLQECGLGACDIVKLCIPAERILTTNPEQVRAMVACAQRLGMPPGSGMFRYALQAVAFLTQEKITAKVEYLKNTFRWSDAEVALAVSRNPSVLRRSKESLQRKSDFLISVVGLEPAYISRISVFITFSLECRLRPRHYVVNFLKENGLLDRERSYYAFCRMTDKAFTDKYICPHKEAAPHLAKYYAAACRGELPAQ